MRIIIVLYLTFVENLKELKKGVVTKSTGSWYSVLTLAGDTYNCRIKGKFKIQGIKSTNPVAVGDYVTIDESDKDDSMIVSIEDRKNYIIRKSINLSKQTHIIAANVDQAMLIVTINYPMTSTIFIDRFLISAKAYDIPVIIIFNKTDMYSQEDENKMKILIDIYEKIGYECVGVSAIKEENTDVVANMLKDKVTVLSGHSGVGKSTLINVIDSTLELRTGEISEYHKSGKHTTTFAEMYPLKNGGYIIDTPGIRGYGIINLEKEELSHFFPEIFKESEKCKYYNCTHIHEPGCAVLEAIKEGRISISRYESYLNLMLDEDKGKYR